MSIALDYVLGIRCVMYIHARIYLLDMARHGQTCIDINVDNRQ